MSTANAGWESFPPKVEQTTDRKCCERCGGEVKPDVFHSCQGVNVSLQLVMTDPKMMDQLK